MAQLDDATDESIVVIIKDQQVAIPKQDILRIDHQHQLPHRKVTSNQSTVSSDINVMKNIY